MSNCIFSNFTIDDLGGASLLNEDGTKCIWGHFLWMMGLEPIEIMEIQGDYTGYDDQARYIGNRFNLPEAEVANLMHRSDGIAGSLSPTRGDRFNQLVEAARALVSNYMSLEAVRVIE